MKIKTITKKINTEGRAEFDLEVNEAIGQGFVLAKRDTLPGVNLGDAYFVPCYHAELVMLDPAPEAPDPLDLLRQVRAFCLSQAIEDCHANKCPMAAWCDQVREGGVDPSDWDLPDEVTP